MVLHALFVRHHILPGEFWRLPKGEQLFLIASIELELAAEERQAKKNG